MTGEGRVASDERSVVVRGLGKRYKRGRGDGVYHRTVTGLLKRLVGRRPAASEDFWALKDVDLDVHRGEVLGIIGPNGAGKSTLLKTIAGITTPSTGEIRLRGRIGALLEVGTGFHPEMSGRENIFLNGAVLGMKREEVRKNLDAIVAFAGVEEFLDTPLKFYSSGMQVRLAFSVAAHLRTDILIVDEVLAVGDAAFQKKCLGSLETLANENRTVLFVSHNMQVIARMCSRVIALDGGRIVGDGAPEDVIGAYLRAGLEGEAERTFTAPPGRGARLDALRLIDGDGRPTALIDQAVPPRLALDLTVERPQDLIVVCTLVTDEGAAVMRGRFSDGDVGFLRVEKPGRVELHAVVPGGLLAPGRYFFRVSVKAFRDGWKEVFESPPLEIRRISGQEATDVFSERGARMVLAAPISIVRQAGGDNEETE